MGADHKDKCCHCETKGISIMTGAELIKWIQENHAENLDVTYTDRFDEEEIVKDIKVSEVMIRTGYKYRKQAAIYIS